METTNHYINNLAFEMIIKLNISAKAPPMEPTLPARISSVYRLAGAVCHLQLLVHDFLFIIFPSRSSFQAPKKPIPFRAVCVSGSVCVQKNNEKKIIINHQSVAKWTTKQHYRGERIGFERIKRNDRGDS